MLLLMQLQRPIPMKNVKLYLLFLLTLIVSSCQTPNAARISQYVGRPNFESPCIANGDGTCFREGGLQDNTNNICGTPRGYDDVQDHLEEIEKRLYICLKFKRKCK